MLAQPFDHAFHLQYITLNNTLIARLSDFSLSVYKYVQVM